MPRIPLPWLLTLALAAASPSQATTIVPPRNLGELARNCRAVVLARAETSWVEDRGLPITVTRFELIEAVAWRSPHGSFLVEVPGGQIGQRGVVISGAPRFVEGRSYLLFLSRARGARLRPQMLGYGLLEETSSGLLRPLPEAAEVEVLEHGKAAVEPVLVYQRDPLIRHLREVKAGARWNATVALAPLSSIVEELHTKPVACEFQRHPGDGLPQRKFGYETGATMSVFHTTPGQVGIADGGVAAVQQGTAAWRNHSDSAINFLYAGSRARVVSCSTGTDIDPGAVTFNDPCNDIADLVACRGTLAFGGSFYDTRTQAYDGEPWHPITTPFVVVNNGAQCIGEVGFREMMTHELGHTQGFGHHTDPDATMAAVLKNDGRGAALRATDGLCAAYAHHSFLDMPLGHWAWRFVEGIENAGLTAGCGGGNYCPTAIVSRQEMAIFLLRGQEGATYTPPQCTTPVFADVPCSNSFAPWINELARRGITSGCGGGNYCPLASVTRQEMAVFLLNAVEGGGYQPPACIVPQFLDVPCSHPYARWINEMARRGITAGCGGGNYCPTTVVARDQIAVFLVRAFGLPFP